jgi:hypothetical protein
MESVDVHVAAKVCIVYVSRGTNWGDTTTPELIVEDRSELSKTLKGHLHVIVSDDADTKEQFDGKYSPLWYMLQFDVAVITGHICVCTPDQVPLQVTLTRAPLAQT